VGGPAARLAAGASNEPDLIAKEPDLIAKEPDLIANKVYYCKRPLLKTPANALQGFFIPPDFETREAHVRTPGYTTNRSAFRTLVTFRGSVRLCVPFSHDPASRDADYPSSHDRSER